MWSVLFDNLLAANILDACQNPQSEAFKDNFYVQKYLYSLILWEAIYKAPRKSYSTTIYTEAEKIRQENELIERVKRTVLDLPFEYDPNEIEMIADEFYGEYLYEKKNDKSVIEDAIFYMALGQIENMNILLSEQRADFVEKSGISRRIWSREDILKYLDREVLEIYQEVYAFWGKDVIGIQTPLLIDYICESATCLQDAINIAFQLKEQKDIIKFRQTMDSLDNAINLGNIIQIREYENALSEIINQFTEKDVPTRKVEIKFTITPSLSDPNISVMFGIPIECNSKRKINMNFLSNLVRYRFTKQ